MNARLNELEEWLRKVGQPGWQWYVKYIPANDTYAKPNVHQGGPYVGKELLRSAFPELSNQAQAHRNPRLGLPAFVASHGLAQDVTLIWYNSKRVEHRANGRDEARLTGWGGMEHPLVAESATGSLVVFAFYQHDGHKDAQGVELWITDSAEEEDVVLEVVGPVDPGAGVLFRPVGGVVRALKRASPCALRADEMRPEWRDSLPTGDEIVDMVLDRMQARGHMAIDERLMKRLACEFELFLSIEHHVVLPRVKEGFANVEEFVRYSLSVTNRRKSRAGKSLELQATRVFNEEGVSYSRNQPTEEKRTPDFIFPSIDRYHDAGWPASKLRMLAAKTTCRDRWRQILNEAKRIGEKHLLTVQEGVTVTQYAEMRDEGVRLVVPKSVQGKYPDAVQPELLSLEDFIAEVKPLSS